ncbi:MAG: hypothetical protein R3C68_09580 [Myxococcota bacterium]
MAPINVLVVGVRHEDKTMPGARSNPDVEEPYPTALFMLGKIVDALMLDRLEYDLQRLNGFGGFSKMRVKLLVQSS